MRDRINSHHAGLAKALYIVLFVPAGGSDIPVLEILLRPQIRLGERRTAKRDARFSADDCDPASVTLFPESYGGIAPSDAAPNDHDRTATDSRIHRVHSAAADAAINPAPDLAGAQPGPPSPTR